MRVSAKADYALRSTIELAAAGPGRTMKAEQIALAQGISLRFLENILTELRPMRIGLAPRRCPRQWHDSRRRGRGP